MKSFLPAIFFSGMIIAIASCQNEEEKFVTEKPEDSRFTKTALVEKLDEPMGLEVLSDGRVIFIERKGKVKMYEPSNGGTKEIGFLSVYFDGEDGLLGMAKDPGFDRNKWIYLYYAPEVQDFVFKCGLGAFTHKGFGMLDLANHSPNQRAEPYKFKREGFIPYKTQDRPKSRESEEGQEEL